MRSMLAGVVVAASAALAFSTTGAADPPATQPAATQPATTSASVPEITWDEAGKHVGETVTVTGPVKGTHVTTGGKALVLNIGKDFPDPTRFTVMINTDEKNPAAPETYADKTVSVTGKIVLYRKVPEIKTDPAGVTVEKD